MVTEISAFKKTSEEKLLNTFLEIERAYSSAPETVFDKSLRSATSFLGMSWLKHNITHYFCDDGLFDFCSSSVRKLTSDYLSLDSIVGDSVPCSFPNYNIFPASRRAPFASQDPAARYNHAAYPPVCAIHFPLKEGHRSILVSTDFNTLIFDKELGIHTVVKNDAIIDDGEDCAVIRADATPFEYGDAKDMVKFVYGFSLYLKAFPDLITEGRGAGIKEFKGIRGRRVQVKKSPVVTEDVQNSRSPHWRRGHFRLLSADCYKKSKGKVVFIKGTFVKGRALQVENIERVMSHA